MNEPDKENKEKPEPVKIEEDGYVVITDDLEYQYVDHNKLAKKGEEISSMRKHFQALRDYSLFSKGATVLDNYMELVSQFGYVVLFAQIFPLGALASYGSNEI